ncbi:hypothetical protein Tco_1485164 [Tanacetum coccineum]
MERQRSNIQIQSQQSTFNIQSQVNIQHSSLLEVIVNGDAPTVSSANAEGPISPKTAEQKLARKNELKAKSTLLLVIPDEHLLKFHGIKDAKTLWKILRTGLEATKNQENAEQPF